MNSRETGAGAGAATPTSTPTPPPTPTSTPTPASTPSPQPTREEEQETNSQDQTSGQEDKQTSSARTTYRVKKGDTISQISAAYYGTISMVPQICELNDISQEDIIYEGQLLLLP